MKRSIPVIFLSFVCVWGAEDTLDHVKYGLAYLEEHEEEFLENVIEKVLEIQPNELGSLRIKQEFEYIDVATYEINPLSSQFDTLLGSSHEAHTKLKASAQLPAQVDNSKLPAFPPIGDQGKLGSCVGWASTYYQASHELALIHGWNNKTSAKHILSPKWTFNLINKGTHVGASPILAYNVLSVNGAPSIEQFPYDHNYTAWDLNVDHWISALSNRMAPATLILGLGGDKEQNLTAIKQALNNGHVLTFASFIDSWVFTKIKPEPGNSKNPYVGQYAAYWMNGQKGGHLMTIVGYDDTIWIDVNQNGAVDPGEKGAFLIANSWGTQWGNQGFIWIAYDAFLSHSKVAGGPSKNRVAAGNYLNSGLISMTPKSAHYRPSLVAEFSLSQSERNQINIKTGLSPQSESKPLHTLTIPAFANEGGALEFDGKISSTPQQATFAIDLSDFLIGHCLPSSKRFYLLVGDSDKGKPTTLNAFSLIDLIHDKTIYSQDPMPQSYENEVGLHFIDY